MKEIVACCGFRCDLCPAFHKNIHGPQDKERVSRCWRKYYGIRIAQEKVGCQGCLDLDVKTLDDACPVRPCAAGRDLDNCAYCPDFMCATLRDRSNAYKRAEKKFAGRIPADEYRDFIVPYAAPDHFERLRKKARRPRSPS